eukprot:639371-Alexandrium_andersonii.AAC.1
MSGHAQNKPAPKAGHDLTKEFKQACAFFICSLLAMNDQRSPLVSAPTETCVKTMPAGKTTKEPGE